MLRHRRLLAMELIVLTNVFTGPSCTSAVNSSNGVAQSDSGGTDADGGEVPAADASVPPSRRTVVIRADVGDTIGTGTVMSDPSGIRCPGMCSMSVDAGTTVSLTAKPDDRSTFLQWGGGCQGSGACRLAPEEDTTVFATFQARAVSGTDDCKGLVPTETRPRFTVKLSRDTTPFTLCSFGEPDGSGSIPILTNLYVNTYDYQFRWLLFDPATGVQYGAIGPALNRFVRLLPQPDGFVGIEFPLGGLSAPARGPLLQSYDRHGVIQSQAPIATLDKTDFEVDPSGGLVSVEVITGTDGNPAFLWRRFDDAGQLTAGPISLPSVDATFKDGWAQAAVSMTGHTLVFYGTRSSASPPQFECRAVWLDENGSALGPAFTPRECIVSGFLPLVDGGLVQLTISYPSFERRLVATWADSSGVPGPIPPFLAQFDANNEVFSIIRHGQGYLVRELASPGALSVFSVSGRKCGVYVPDIPQWWVGTGRDGTFVTMTQDADCTFRWYPQLFK